MRKVVQIANGDDGWGAFLDEAQRIVRDKLVWRRFIDGTPLANDIPVWMADFAMMVRRRERENYQACIDAQAAERDGR